MSASSWPLLSAAEELAMSKLSYSDKGIVSTFIILWMFPSFSYVNTIHTEEFSKMEGVEVWLFYKSSRVLCTIYKHLLFPLGNIKTSTSKILSVTVCICRWTIVDENWQQFLLMSMVIHENWFAVFWVLGRPSCMMR